MRIYEYFRTPFNIHCSNALSVLINKCNRKMKPTKKMEPPLTT